MNSSRGVIILGNEHQAIGLLRQLHPLGIKCVLVDQDRFGIAMFSRYNSRFHQSPPYESDEFWPWFKDLAHKYGYIEWVIIPTDDEQVRQLSQNYDEVTNLFKYAGMPWNKYSYIYNKRNAYKWVSELGIDMPQTFLPREKDNFHENTLAFPFILKPAIKRRFRKYSKKKAIVVNSEKQLKNLIKLKFSEVPIEDFLFQEIIPGGGASQWSYAGFFVEGKPVAAFTACRKRQHPPDYGKASTYVEANYDEEVEKHSKKILSELNYTGLAEVEWKRDTRDGKLKFFEVNARCWGWHSIASKVVGNIPKMLHDYLLDGSSTNTNNPNYGVTWIKWFTDIPTSMDLLIHREITLTDYFKSIFRPHVHCDWNLRDPLPFFMQFILLPYLWWKRGY